MSSVLGALSGFETSSGVNDKECSDSNGQVAFRCLNYFFMVVVNFL